MDGISVPELRKAINDALDAALPSADEEPREVHAAMRHAVLGEGHRWRPRLLVETGLMYGCAIERLMPAAVGVEFGHCASVILDDLPCMDNASSRRAKPACHVVYGQATTILASLELTMLALKEFRSYGPILGIDVIARDVICEMIAGQSADLRSATAESVGYETAENVLGGIHLRKTGPLFRLAVKAGALIAGAPDWDIKTLDEFAASVALAYQALDDVCDADGTATQQGKPAHRDEGKVTAVSAYGIEGARRVADGLLLDAFSHLRRVSCDTSGLKMIARRICSVRE